MNHYQCHKKVRAAKVVGISDYDQGGCRVLDLDNGETVSVFRDSQFKNTEVGDYYVVYDDNYASRSPAKAFEEGYTLIEEAAAA